MILTDSHTHLDYQKDGEIEATLKKCDEAGVKRQITIGVSADNQEKVIQLTKQFSSVYGTLGIHPHHAIEYEDGLYNPSQPKIIAVGEIGLDYHYNFSPQDVQKIVFEKQLQLAVDHNLPVVMHTREAEEDTLAILKNFPQLQGRVVAHSYTASLAMAKQLLDWGFFIGVNGIVTFPKSDNVREVVSLLPLDRLLLETDSPYLAPIPHRGKENHSYYLPHIAEAVAKIKQISLAEVSKATEQNVERLFQKIQK